MAKFIYNDFLLGNTAAQQLYHEVAAELPIIDYHNHLPPDVIAEDKQFSNLTEIWLAGDHYKWRAMRACGVDENLITGDASDKEKFLAWAQTVPKTLKNPLYHWTHMELANPFGITDRLLDENSAERIWDECNEKLQSPEFSARSLLSARSVEVVATTDDPTSDLKYHQTFRNEEAQFLMVPTFRPDKGMNLDQTESFQEWIRDIEKLTGISIQHFEDLRKALKDRHDFFHELGCRASDHGISQPFSEPFTESDVDGALKKALKGEPLTSEENNKYKSAFLYECALLNHEKGWVYQLHIGALRNNNSRMMKKLGPDSGYDSIGDVEMALPLSRLLDRLDSTGELPKTILYNLNPRDNELIGAMIGNFQDGVTPGKLQHGPPWWFLDQKNGIEEQIESLSNMGILSQFVGMTTDSRSFLSFSRHDYFRRILCNIIGNDMERGLIPNDHDMAANLIEKICFKNVKSYFQYSE